MRPVEGFELVALPEDNISGTLTERQNNPWSALWPIPTATTPASSGAGAGAAAGGEGASGAGAVGISPGGTGGQDGGIDNLEHWRYGRKYQKHFRIVHGILMSLVVLILFPLGAIFMNIFKVALVHAAWQIIALLILIAGFGIGVMLARVKSLVCTSTSPPHPLPNSESNSV